MRLSNESGRLSSRVRSFLESLEIFICTVKRRHNLINNNLTSYKHHRLFCTFIYGSLPCSCSYLVFVMMSLIDVLSLGATNFSTIFIKSLWLPRNLRVLRAWSLWRRNDKNGFQCWWIMKHVHGGQYWSGGCKSRRATYLTSCAESRASLLTAVRNLQVKSFLPFSRREAPSKHASFSRCCAVHLLTAAFLWLESEEWTHSERHSQSLHTGEI